MNKILTMVVMLGMAGGAFAADFSELAVRASDLKAAAAPDLPEAAKGCAESAAPAQAVEFITIPGGKFLMGTGNEGIGLDDAKPIHEAAIRTFEMSKTDVTVGQYAECVSSGRCTKPATGDYCNWGVADRQYYPVNCVDWYQANQYAEFKGARLPSESEWEYAATSGGRNRKYPWGNGEPTRDNAVMYIDGADNDTMPVCSKPAGNTAQGLCDMAGNVWQWVQDNYQDSYKNAPVDGSAFEGAGGTGQGSSERVIRGGSFINNYGRPLRAGNRVRSRPDVRLINIGFRIAR